jgi:hypothetical protein
VSHIRPGDRLGVRGADQGEGRVRRVDRDGILVDWGGRLGTQRHDWSDVGARLVRLLRRTSDGPSKSRYRTDESGGSPESADPASPVGGRERHRQPPLRDEQHLLQPRRARLPQHPRQPAAAAHDDVVAQDAVLDVVVGAEREGQGGLRKSLLAAGGWSRRSAAAPAARSTSQRPQDLPRRRQEPVGSAPPPLAQWVST